MEDKTIGARGRRYTEGRWIDERGGRGEENREKEC